MLRSIRLHLLAGAGSVAVGVTLSIWMKETER